MQPRRGSTRYKCDGALAETTWNSAGRMAVHIVCRYHPVPRRARGLPLTTFLWNHFFRSPLINSRILPHWESEGGCWVVVHCLSIAPKARSCMNQKDTSPVDGQVHALLGMQPQMDDLVGPEWHSVVLTDPSFYFRGTVLRSQGAGGDKGFVVMNEDSPFLSLNHSQGLQSKLGMSKKQTGSVKSQLCTS